MTELASQPLSSLSAGCAGVVEEIQLPPESRPRLMELGLVSGTPIEVIRFALMGDPIEIKVRGYNLTLRKHEADHILVRPSR